MKKGLLSRKCLVIAAVLALGLASAVVTHAAFAQNQQGHGTSDNAGGGAGGGGPGNQGHNDKDVGNSCCNF